MCLETGDSGADGTKLFPHYPDLLGDRLVLPFDLHLFKCLHKYFFTLYSLISDNSTLLVNNWFHQ